MNKKILKKILGIFNYKLINKNLVKNNRIISQHSSLNIEMFLKEIFKKNIKQLIQIGANDGKRFDKLNKFIIKNKTNAILIEPIKKNFKELSAYYNKYKNVKLENSAISVNNELNFLYKVNESYLKYYGKHIPGITSFNKKHLIDHGVKKNHILKEKVQTISIKKVLEKYKLKKLDLLYIDVEGYDGKIVLDFLSLKLFNTIIIFEYIHIDQKIFKKVIKKILSSGYKFISIDENLVCLPKNKIFKI